MASKAPADPITALANTVAESKKLSLIASAIAVVGPREKDESFEDYSDAVRDAGFTILDIASSGAGSDLGHLMVPGIRRYRAKLLNFERDPVKQGKDWSTRMLLTLGVKPSQYAKDGTEVIRTERTDIWDGSGRRVGLLAKGLVGHDVIVWVAPDGDEGQYRVLRHIQDLGESED